MKFKLFVIFLLLVTTYNLNAQINFGVNAGVNMNDIESKNGPILYEDNLKKNIGLHIGLFSFLNISDKLTLNPAFQFSQKRVGTDNGITAVKANYLELPILVSYEIVRQINVELGSSIAYNISDEMFIDNNFDFGLTGGVRFSFTNTLFIYGRYYYGLSKLNEIYEVDSNNNQNITTYHNRNIYFGIGYSFTK